MARKVSESGTRRYRCPICDEAGPQGSNFATARGLAQHIAMKWDKAHLDWRIERNIVPPHRPTDMPTVQRMIPEILKYLPHL